MRTCTGLLLAILLSACGGDDGSIVERGCERDDECNFLPAGTSVSECIDEVENILDNVSDGQRADLETMFEACLEFETCSAYQQCTDNISI